MLGTDSKAIVSESGGVPSYSLDDLSQELARRGKTAFSVRFSCPFLLVIATAYEESDEIDLKTTTGEFPRDVDFSSGSLKKRAVPLKKSDRNVMLSKITVGRARNNDIVIRSKMISKLHGTFWKDQGEWKLQDMGSRNGTTVNGLRIREKKTVTLRDGDLISLWEYMFEFVVPDRFSEMLAQQSSEKLPDTLG
jgi:hypothetical protein